MKTLTAEDQETLEKMLQFYDTATRLGAEEDVPEGNRYIQLSDTLAKQFAESLRSILVHDQRLRV